MSKQPELTAASIARKHGVVPRFARIALRAAGFKAPYSPKDLAKITAIIKGEKANAHADAGDAKPAKAKKPAATNAS